MAGDSAYVFQDDGTYAVRISPNRDRKRGRERLRWRVEGYYQGHRKGTLACSVFAHEGDARECARLLWEDYVGGLHQAPDAPPVTLGELVDRFLAREKGKRGRKLSENTARAYDSQLGALLRVAGRDCPIPHVSRRHVEAALAEPNQRHKPKDKDGKGLKPAPKSEKTQEQYLRAMKAFVRWALKLGWLRVDITAGVEADPGPYEMGSYLQPDEVDAFLTACRPAHRIRAGLIIETGLRADEAAHLRWDWVVPGVKRPTLRVPALDSNTGFHTKGRRVRPVPLSEKAQKLLEDARARWGATGFVLHDQKTPPDTGNWCRDTHRACRKSGVTDVNTHGLRRTAGALWIASGVDIYTVCRLLGHQSVTTTERAYAGIAHGHLATAMELVDARAALPKVGEKHTPETGAPEKGVEETVEGNVEGGAGGGGPELQPPLQPPNEKGAAEARNPLTSLSQHPDSNRGPADYESAALPTELCWRAALSLAGPGRRDGGLYAGDPSLQAFFFRGGRVRCLPASGGGLGLEGVAYG